MLRAVAVIGTGNIGATLGVAFARVGHTVTFGVRDPATANRPEGAPDDVEVTDLAAALARADVIVLALPGPAVAGLVREHPAVLDGRLVIDATNNMAGGPANSHDVITTAVPGVRYARAFNTLGVENLRDPEFAGQRADMLFSAAEADRPTLADLIDAVGLRPVWVGDNTHDTVDGMLRLWFALARNHGRHLAFRVLTDTGQIWCHEADVGVWRRPPPRLAVPLCAASPGPHGAACPGTGHSRDDTPTAIVSAG